MLRAESSKGQGASTAIIHRLSYLRAPNWISSAIGVGFLTVIEPVRARPSLRRRVANERCARSSAQRELAGALTARGGLGGVRWKEVALLAAALGAGPALGAGAAVLELAGRGAPFSVQTMRPKRGAL